MVKISAMTRVIAPPPELTADPKPGKTKAKRAVDPKNPQTNRAWPSRIRVGIARGPYKTKAGPNMKAADRAKNAIARS
ncbi:MAG: hypothetical protein Hens2KO_30450 [Henriciella sp.]